MLAAIRKSVVAFVTIALLALIAATKNVNLSDGIDGDEWWVIVVGVLNFVGVYWVPNRTGGSPDGTT